MAHHMSPLLDSRSSRCRLPWLFPAWDRVYPHGLRSSMDIGTVSVFQALALQSSEPSGRRRQTPVSPRATVSAAWSPTMSQSIRQRVTILGSWHARLKPRTAAGNIGAATRVLVIEQYPQRHGGWRGEKSRSVGKPNPKPRVRSDNHTARGSRFLPRCRRFIDRNTWATRRTGQDGLYGFRSGLLRSVRRIGVPGKSNASRSPLTRYRR